MARRRKLTSNWPPAGWDISYEWEFKGKPVLSRKHELRIRRKPGHNAEWIRFDYHCINNNNGKIWISGFDAAGFTACYPECVIGVREYREKKVKNPRDVTYPKSTPTGRPSVRKDATSRAATAQPTRTRKRRSDAGKKRGPRKTKTA